MACSHRYITVYADQWLERDPRDDVVVVMTTRCERSAGQRDVRVPTAVSSPSPSRGRRREERARCPLKTKRRPGSAPAVDDLVIILRKQTTIIIIITIIAEMTVFNVAGWLPRRGKAQVACNYCFPTRTIFQINLEFCKKGTFR